MTIDTLLPWSPPELVPTKVGPRLLRRARPNESFWSKWATDKTELQSQGIYAVKQDNEWVACWWSMPPVQADVPPWILERLRDYQRGAAQTMVTGLKHHRFLLDASDCGIGKTYLSLATAITRKAQPLVICKKAGISAWQRVWRDHFSQTSPLDILNYEMLRTGKTEFGKWTKVKRVVRSVDVFRFTEVPNRLVLWDEVHAARGASSQNGEMLMACYEQGIPSIGMSATAINSPIHMKSLGACLGLHNRTDFFQFLLQHGVSKTTLGMQFNCGMTENELTRFDPRVCKQVKIPEGQEELRRRQTSIMAGLHKRIFMEGKGVRLRKQDIPGFPVLTILPKLFDFADATPGIRQAYRNLKIRMASDEGKRHAMAILKETQIEVECLKVKGLKDEIEQLLEEGNSVCVFLNFNRSVDMICAMLKTQCCIRGGQTPRERDHWIDNFQANNERVIVANNMAGGDTIGLHDLHGGYPRVSLICPTPWAEQARQCSGRTPRNGAKSPSIAMFPYALGTQEEKTYQLMLEKWDRIDAFNDASILETLIG